MSPSTPSPRSPQVMPVLLRAQSAGRSGSEKLARTRAVAEELVARGARTELIVDDEACASRLRHEGFAAWSLAARPGWALERALGAWLDGDACDWTEDLRRLARNDVPRYLVANRTAAREWASFVVQPKLFRDDDPWERLHEERVLRGPEWIPLSRAVRALRRQEPSAVDVLVTFGESDPAHATERVLRALPCGTRAAVSVGARMQARRAGIRRAGGHLTLQELAPHEPLSPWMARSGLAITAIGFPLFELAYLRTPALVLGLHGGEGPVLDHYRRQGPFRPLGLASELDDAGLARAIARERARVNAPSAPITGLGEGAARLAERLLEPRALRAVA